MKIIIAAWHLKDPNVGIGRYCRALIEGLGRVDSDNEYMILVPEERCIFPVASNVEFRVWRLPVFKRRCWELCAPLLNGDYDLIHFPYEAGVRWSRGKVVLTVHDVKPLIFPELRSKKNINNILHDVVLGNKWSRVDQLVTVSNYSRRDIIQHLPISPERVSVVRQGVSLQLFHSALPTDSPLIETERKYILSLAGNDPTKNLSTLIKAFSQLPLSLRNAYDLVLAGDLRRRHDLRQLVRELNIEPQIQFPGSISDGKLVELYQRASLFVFPSRYEGFGLPILEAMACGCPVVSSNASSLPEVAGDAAVLVDPFNVQGFASAIERMLSDPHVRHTYIEKGLAHVQQFSWDRTAHETIKVYQQVLGSA